MNLLLLRVIIIEYNFNTCSGLVMGIGGGIHDDAVDVTYLTKPDINNYGDSGLEWVK